MALPKNNIYTGPDGRYRYQYTDQAGQRKDLRSRKGEGKRDFARRCEETEEAGPSQVTSTMTLDKLFNNWQELYQTSHCSAGDVATISQAYRLYVQPTLGRMDISGITKLDVLNLLNALTKKGYSRSIVTKARQTISRPYNWAITYLSLDVDNPARGLRVRAQVTEANPVRVITQQEYERFLEAAINTRYYYLYQVMWLTGLRPSEALALKKEDIGDTVLRIRRGLTRYGHSKLKTVNAARLIPISDELRRVLDLALSESEPNRAGWLFPGEHGTEPSANALRLAFVRTRKQTAVWKKQRGNPKGELSEPAVDFTMYDFRHTFGTRMAHAGMSHKTLQYIMGHSDIGITMKYYVGVDGEALVAAQDVMNEHFVLNLSSLPSTILSDTQKPSPIKPREIRRFRILPTQASGS